MKGEQTAPALASLGNVLPVPGVRQAVWFFKLV